MNLFARALTKIFKSGNQQELTKIKPIINAINEQEKSISALKDEEFPQKTFELRKSIKEGLAIEKIIPDAIFECFSLLSAEMLCLRRVKT